ncbi:DMT family transporter [Ruegeria sp. HKCCD8929]|uniref:DMT family transporter n=1 Tax=Ruegeria sp. HKCCD8929 TaxID=2683006 RepID=UPI0014888BB2|nr:DMT family transporter [Ruegeria sp. HKCCD8929]
MNNVNGILLVIASMAAFTLEDMFVKQLSDTVSTGQILVVLGVVSSIVFLGMAVVTRKRIFLRQAWQPIPLLRAATETVGALTFVTALSLVDLSTVAAVFQALPLTITMGAALFMGEQVGWRRWSAIFVGFAGVLLIIRPGTDGFQPESLFVVATVIAIAARDLITRLINHRVPSAVVASQAYLALILSGAALMLFTSEPVVPLQPGQIWPYAGALAFGVLGYYGIVTAMRVGEASAITPFRYTRLLFSILAGMLVFGERPDTLTLMGASLIIGSGLYTFVRERRLAREMALAAA